MRLKRALFTFSSTKDPWGFDYNQLHVQAGIYEETGMAMQALWEVRNFSFRNPIYDCWQAPYSVDTFFFIGATLVSYLLLKVLMKIYIKNIKLTFHRTLTRPTGGSTRRVLSTWCSSIWTGLTPKFTWPFLWWLFLHISKKTSQAFSSTDCFASASLMASSFSSWSGWRTVARILSEWSK